VHGVHTRAHERTSERKEKEWESGRATRTGRPSFPGGLVGVRARAALRTATVCRRQSWPSVPEGERDHGTHVPVCAAPVPCPGTVIGALTARNLAQICMGLAFGNGVSELVNGPVDKVPADYHATAQACYIAAAIYAGCIGFCMCQLWVHKQNMKRELATI
jgi:hypothetical protein